MTLSSASEIPGTTSSHTTNWISTSNTTTSPSVTGDQHAGAIRLVPRCWTPIYPYLHRVIAGTPYFDLVTAYGYGGPVFLGQWEVDQVSAAREHFVESCRSRLIITETVRFHPLLDNAAVGRSWVDVCRAVQPTTAVDLRRPLTEVLSGIEKRTQRNIRKAEREGVSVRKAGLGEVDTFIALYWETMDKRHAEDRYYFGPDYFKALLGSDRIDAEFLMAEREGEVIAACLVLYGPDFAHHPPRRILACSFVASSQPPALPGDDRGGSPPQKKFLHLGGGATADRNDSLLLFKKTFSAGAEQVFSLGQSILDTGAYEQVCRDFLHRYAGAGGSNWFPLYRTPLDRLQVVEASPQGTG